MVEQMWSVILHGGARAISPKRQERNRAGCHVVATQIGEFLRTGGSALDAATLAVRMLEDDPTYNAGTGSVPNSSGDLELDAAVMEGATLSLGAVAALRGVRNPVLVARMLLDEPAVLLVGDGAQAFAARRGVVIDDGAGREQWPVDPADHDTVGCVALDVSGRIAVATSTGGVPGQVPGRVGDAPIPGAGFYADNGIGGVAISGDGESVLRSVLAYRVIDGMREASAARAATDALEAMARVGGEAGIVAIAKNGRFGISHGSDHFAVGLAASWLDGPRAGIHRDEFEDLLHD